MKKLNIFIAALSFLSVSYLYSCNSNNSGDQNASDTTIVELEEKMDNLEASDSLSGGEGKKLGKEYTAKYICPDHCKGSGSDKAGECADCGMELIENQSFGEK